VNQNPSPDTFRIPSLIKRNTVLFALSQSFTGAGMQLAYGIGPLMVIALTGSANLAGLFVGLIGLSRFLVSYPIGRIMDLYGRKPGIYLGLVFALIGSVMIGTAMEWRSVIGLGVGMLIFGMGMNAANQMRVAATDMFPPRHRATALGYVALGSVVGLFLSPIVIALSERFAPGIGPDPMSLAWFMLPPLIIGGMIMVRFVQPDPKQIGMRLGDYYPGYRPPERAGGDDAKAFTAMTLLRESRTRLAIVANCAGQGNMSIVMVLTSLVLAHHGHSLTHIAMSHLFHSVGMFAFTIPLGKLADRFGRERVMYPGVATTLVGAGLVAFTSGYWEITLGTFLVGIGWAAANVSATALIADRVRTEVRGRAIGVNESFAGATAVFAAVVTGPLVEWGGLPATGMTAVLLAAIPLVMVLTTRHAKG
jgi:MFS family permease